MPTTLTNGIQLPDKGSVDWYSSMQSNYNLIDTHLGDTDTHVTAEDKANWNSKQGSLSQAQLDAIAQVATNTSDIATLQSGKANASHTHSSSDITDIGDYATKQYVDTSISGLVDNAPAALDTLKELSTALNDDANFASTVTTALSAKANSADLATVATSGDYNDLDNLPTIPTKTSDLTNDSNFVDTSNSAVASGITSAKVTSYDSHIADTDIHVTTADKNKWNNQTYVFRYSSTALVASSTNSNTLLDNTDNLKVGDKVIDSSGVLFSITAIDTANSTFTVGSALIDLALDANVVHTSGNETISGDKTFTNRPIIYNASATVQADVPNLLFKNPLVERASTTLDGEQTILFTDKNNSNIASIQAKTYTSGISDIILTSYSENDGVRTTGIVIRRTPTTSKFHGYSDNITSLGDTNRRWKSVYATNYYYGSDNTEFSTKFVTTDTAQTISGTKTFTDNNMIKTSSPKVLLINTSQTGNTPPSSNAASFFRFDGGTVNNFGGVQCEFLTTGENRLTNYVNDITKARVNTIQQRASSTTAMTVFNTDLLVPATDGVTALGSNSKRWSDCQTKLINGLTPSSLGMPNLNNAVDISGYLTNAGTTTPSEYTPPVNGWMCIGISADSPPALRVFTDSGFDAYSYSERSEIGGTGGIYTRYGSISVPVVAGVTYKIIAMPSSVAIITAKFFPCQGNI